MEHVVLQRMFSSILQVKEIEWEAITTPDVADLFHWSIV